MYKICRKLLMSISEYLWKLQINFVIKIYKDYNKSDKMRFKETHFAYRYRNEWVFKSNKFVTFIFYE